MFEVRVKDTGDRLGDFTKKLNRVVKKKQRIVYVRYIYTGNRYAFWEVLVENT
jgi:hypothetical protein